MSISVILAQAIGLSLTIIGGGMLIRGPKLKPSLKLFLTNPEITVLSGVLTLALGILIVVSHNLWVMDWRVMITILGYLSILRGIVRMFYPEFVINKSMIWLESKKGYNIGLIITFLVGVLLLYLGYMHG